MSLFKIPLRILGILSILHNPCWEGAPSESASPVRILQYPLDFLGENYSHPKREGAERLWSDEMSYLTNLKFGKRINQTKT